MRHASANANSPLRKKIKEICDAMYSTQAGVADDLNVSPSVLSQILRNNNATPHFLQRVDELHAEAMAEKRHNDRVHKIQVAEDPLAFDGCNGGERGRPE